MGLLRALGKRGMQALESGQMFGRVPVEPDLNAIKAVWVSRLALRKPDAAAAIQSAQNVEEISSILKAVTGQADEGYLQRAAITQRRNSPYGPSY